MREISEIAAEEAEDIEQSDSARDAGLTGQNVLDVDATIGTDGRVKEITVRYNTHGASVAVDLYSGSLTASAGMESHRVPLFDTDDTNVGAVLEDARRYWEATVDGISVEA